MRNHRLPKRAPPRKPFPDSLPDGAGYQVLPGPPGVGGVQFVNRIMQVPVGAEAFDRFVKLHEMGHVLWTPKVLPHVLAHTHGISVESLQVCEDARINSNLQYVKGFPMSTLGYEDLTEARQELERLSRRDRGAAIMRGAELLVASECRNKPAMQEMLASLDLEDAIGLGETALAALVGDGDDFGPCWDWEDGALPFERTVAAARVLDAGKLALRLLMEHEDGLARMPGLGAGAMRMEMVPWGELTIKKLPMGRRRVPARSPQWHPTDTGLRLRNVSRVLTDGRCFARRLREPGGSLLIDGSASMSLSPEELQQILAIAPLAWVGIYSGRGDGGVLRILARDGHCVPAHEVCAEEHMHGNIVDGPALEVLTQQSTPRIWICDGYVTGCGDASGLGNRVEAAALCTKGNILRIDTVAEAIEYLKTLARP